MTPILNLHILAEKFTQLSNAVYFDPAFKEFSERTADVARHVISHEQDYSAEIVRAIQDQLWRVLQFVSGSRSSDAPHEVQYALRKAIKHWTNEDALISSASLNQLDFFLDPIHLWDFIGITLHLFDAQGYNKSVVRIASPEAYKNKPIFCVPLFHELGHYVDVHYKLSEASMLLNPPPPPPAGVQAQAWNGIHVKHRMEHFADLFAACYCGDTTNKSLLALAPDNGASHTHPATSVRIGVVNRFLANVPDQVVEIFQNVLRSKRLPLLNIRYSAPDIVTAFDDVLVYRIRNEAELFGIFHSAWNYLEDRLSNRSAPWIVESVTASEIEKTVNDLVEKSIRNYEVRERWEHGVAGQR